MYFYLDSDFLLCLLFVIVSHAQCVLQDLSPISGITKHKKIKMLYTAKIYLNDPTQ